MPGTQSDKTLAPASTLSPSLHISHQDGAEQAVTLKDGNPAQCIATRAPNCAGIGPPIETAFWWGALQRKTMASDALSSRGQLCISKGPAAKRCACIDAVGPCRYRRLDTGLTDGHQADLCSCARIRRIAGAHQRTARTVEMGEMRIGQEDCADRCHAGVR